ncbi:DEAD/DEAH box helicase family protein [Nonomuraea angiospora]|uniref:Superfamily II DNA or RNA helicase n=1 Tax=Nonomuraea angiospora TaxID=46172 RepID=A0ABR9M6Q1_9ACTN|nr:DEAD/DEAH box helicase family protein [Nonomuraea angiospora]MBE1588207.1 superfamily II DNA or RNA helicase [Nonomuraea angiospora]
MAEIAQDRSVDLWPEWNDPVELRMRLDAALVEIAELREENGRLKQLLRQRASAAGDRDLVDPDQISAVPVNLPQDGLPYADASSPPSEKLALFKALFVGRRDVYATRFFSRKSGGHRWSPAEKEFWRKQDDAEREFLPLTDEILIAHLSRPADGRDSHVGLYPMLPDDTCRLLACDFDGAGWQGDAAAYAEACTRAGIHTAAEISRSGAGAHVWMFFTEPVLAASARAIGMGLLREAIDRRGTMSLASYDRLFPAQDSLPVKAAARFRFGNLIALPLHGGSREQGTTLFCDPHTWQPYEDQFAFLSGVRRLRPVEVDALVKGFGQIDAGPSTWGRLPSKPRWGALGVAPQRVHAQLGAMLAISTDSLPAPLIAALKHLAAFHNPEFYRRQSMRYSTFATPRFVRCFDDSDPDWLRLPRGLAEQAEHLIAAAGGAIEIATAISEHDPIMVRFTGELTNVQTEAVTAMAKHLTGVLMAPPGAGKTVMACALIAWHQVPTAIIVNRAELLDQWKERLTTFLDLDATQVGAKGKGKDKRHGVVDVIMLQSVAHRDADPSLLDAYGMVIVDECHAVGAPAAEAAIRQMAVKRWIGLSATPYRADQMDALITMQCGPIRHEITPEVSFAQRLIVHTTGFSTEEIGYDGASFQAIYGELAADDTRTAQIACDVADAARRGRNSLLLTNRMEHLQCLAAALEGKGVAATLLHGQLSAAERDRVRARLTDAEARPLVLLAIDKVAGEGFDLPWLDALFLAMPISFKGKVIQHVGRIMREAATKHDVEVHDYLDAQIPQLERMYGKRRRTLTRLGFTTTTPGSNEHPPTTDASPRPSSPRTPAEITRPRDQQPTPSRVRAWAREQGLPVADRGRLRPEIWEAWHAAAGPMPEETPDSTKTS